MEDEHDLRDQTFKRNSRDRTIKGALEDINRRLGRTRFPKSSASIFKIPPELLNAPESAFNPETFCFGPFHHKEEGSMYYNIKKQHLLRLFGGKVRGISGSKTHEDTESQSRKPNSLEKVLEAMFEFVPKIKECYNHLPDIYPPRELIRMMVEDGCSMIEFLRKYDKKTQHDARGGSSDSPIFEGRWLLPTLQRDMMKLENQLPLFVLEKLFSETASENDEPSSLHDLVMTFFCSMLSLEKSIYKLDPSPTRNYAHLLDLFRSSFIFSMSENQEDNEVHEIFIGIPKLIYSAQDLQEAGVKITEKKHSRLLDISFDFDKGELQIPTLSIDVSMTVALLNFVAYEQCDQSIRPYFTSYLLFLYSLINTTKDVVILRKKKVISYPRGTEKEVVDLFNNFCKGMLNSFDQACFSVDMNAVNKYCDVYYEVFQTTWRAKWHVWCSDFRKERCSSPWKILSLLAAIVLLTLTMLQTFFTIFPYYHPN